MCGDYVTLVGLERGISSSGGCCDCGGGSEKRGGGDRLAMSAGGAVLGEILSRDSSASRDTHTRIDVPSKE